MPGEPPPLIASGTSQARVVSLSICTDSECSFSECRHLLARTTLVDLERGNAVALSYTWGEFDRKCRVIGHHDDDERTPLVMELGEEWKEHPGVDRGLTGTLVDICADLNTSLWIDQLSIAQDNDEEVRATLARIPDIYRTFDVVAILPGSLCRCWRERNEASAGTATGPLPGQATIAFRRAFAPGNELDIGRTPDERRRMAQAPRHALAANVKTEACWNNVGFSSWFQRVWTRQELLYARNIRAVWTAKDLLECPVDCWEASGHKPESIDNILDQVQGLNIMGRLGFQRFMNQTPVLFEPGSSDLATAEIKTTLDALSERPHVNAEMSLILWEQLHGPEAASGENRGRDLIARLLCGETLSEMVPLSDRMMAAESEQFRIRQFLEYIDHLRLSVREATQERDLVVAIWVDCPKYVLPVAYKHMSLGQLLDDALHQLERNWGISLVSSMPQGLFRRDTKAMFWRPSAYLRSQASTPDTESAYGSLLSAKSPYAFECFPNGHTKHVALFSMEGNDLDSASAPMLDFEDMFSACSGEDTFEFIASVAKSWGIVYLLQLRFWSAQLRRIRNPLDHDLYKFITALVQRRYVETRVFDEEDRERNFSWHSMLGRTTTWTPSQTADHCHIVYSITCRVLGVDPIAARQAGLRTVVDFGGDRQGNPRIGLANSSLPWRENLETKTYTVTPCGPSSTRDDSQKSVLFQIYLEDGPEGIERLEGSGRAVYRDYQVVGVWIESDIHSADRGVQGYIFNHGLADDVMREPDQFDKEEVQAELLSLLSPEEVAEQIGLLSAHGLLKM